MAHAIPAYIPNINPEVIDIATYTPATDIGEITARSLSQLKAFDHFEHGRPYSFRALEFTGKIHMILSIQRLLNSADCVVKLLENIKNIAAEAQEVFPHKDLSIETFESTIKSTDETIRWAQKILELAEPELCETPFRTLLETLKHTVSIKQMTMDAFEAARRCLFSFLETPEVTKNVFLYSAIKGQVLLEQHEVIRRCIEIHNSEKLEAVNQKVLNTVEKMMEKLSLYIEIQHAIDVFNFEVNELPPSRKYDKAVISNIVSIMDIQYHLDNGCYLSRPLSDVEETLVYILAIPNATQKLDLG